MITSENNIALQVSSDATMKTGNRIAEVLRLARLAEKEVGGLRELSIAELGRVGGGAVVGTTN